MFPNKHMMDKCFREWTDKEKGEPFSKPCFKEEKETLRGTFIKYEKECWKQGAILFAVARGNYGEGYDFKDKLCRGLIIIGVPNLNLGAPKVKLKKAYYEYIKSINGFNEWYHKQRDYVSYL